MIKWGALIDPDDRDGLIEYLSANFSPGQPAYEPPHSSAPASAKATSGKRKPE
jgi:hypothetical protein